MEGRKVLTLILAVVFIILVVFLLRWRSANVVLNLEKNYSSVGDILSEKINITIKPTESIDIETPIIIALTDSDNNVVAAKTFYLKTFIENSNNNIEYVENNGKYYYETPGTYTTDIKNLMSYKFDKEGEYYLSFNVLKMDLNINEKITVK